jgi:Flp pilus assembly protein TadG
MAKPPNGTRGSEAIEFALVLPVFLMFVLGIADCARLIWTNTTLAQATAVAARCGAINTSLCGTSSLVASYAAAQAVGLGLTSAAFTVSTQACGTQVAGTMTYQFFIPWFYGASPFGASNQLTLHAVSCYPL